MTISIVEHFFPPLEFLIGFVGFHGVEPSVLHHYILFIVAAPAHEYLLGGDHEG